MKPGRLAIVVADKSPAWISCQSISSNLRKAYEIAAEDSAIFAYQSESLRISTLALAKEIRRWGATTIVFLDHLPHPAPLIYALDTLWADEPRPRLIFHVYGDFTLYPFQWMSVDQILRGYEIAFVTASPRQSLLVSRFLRRGSASLFTVGFPVDTKIFRPSLKSRQAGRERLKLSRLCKAIVYSGRLSVQKNIVPMIQIVGGMMARSGSKFKFYIAGPIDELGVPLFSKRPAVEGYRAAIENATASLPARARYGIKLLGHLDAPELADLYNAADVFVSPSLHHDEDFGMAPAEALMCGAPSVLTDWGGYAQFIEHEMDGHRVPVSLSKKGLEFDPRHFEKGILATTWAAEKFSQRKERSERCARRFSIESIATKLSGVLEANFQKFLGFAPLMRRLREAHRDNKAPFPSGPKKGTFYEEVYSTYLE